MGKSGEVNVLQEISTQLVRLIEHIDRTESKIEQIEHKIILAASSSESSKKKSISPVVRFMFMSKKCSHYFFGVRDKANI